MKNNGPDLPAALPVAPPGATARSPGVCVTLIITLATALAAPAAFAQWKWKDASGGTQYGDSPPPGVQATRLRPLPGTASGTASGSPPAAAAPMSMAEQEQAFRRRQMEAQEAEKKQLAESQRAEQMRERCIQARGYLAGLENGGRVVRFNEAGERQYLDDAQVEEAKARARQAVAEACR